MQPQTIFLQGLTPEQFFDNVRAIIRHEMAQAHSAAEATQQPSSDDLLTIKQAAEMLDVSVATVHEHKRTGRLPYTKIAGRSYIRRSAVLAAGTQHQRTTKPGRVKDKPPAK
ncbi:MAG: helix-turn-helix domain-containing protein [Janthinobacterium lividum]